MPRKPAHRPESFHHSVNARTTILDEFGAREVYERGPHQFSRHDVDLTCETDTFHHVEVGITVLSPEYPLQRQLDLKAYGGANTSLVVMEVSAEWHSDIHYHAAVLLKTANEEVRMKIGPLGDTRVVVSDLHGNGRTISQIRCESVRNLVSDLSDPTQKEQVWQRICEEIRG